MILPYFNQKRGIQGQLTPSWPHVFLSALGTLNDIILQLCMVKFGA